MDYFKSEGSVQKICKDLASMAEVSIFDFLKDNKEILEDDESLVSYTKNPSFPPDVIGFMTPQYNYYINIKITTIVIVASILDITLTKGVISTILNMCGFSSTSIVKLDERNGEKCIVKETLLSENKTGYPSILRRFAGECCNNDMNCRFKNGAFCSCTEQDIIIIYQRLAEKNLFKKLGDSFEYQW